MSFSDQLMTIYSELKVIALSKSSGYAEAEDLLHDTLIRSIEIQDKYTTGTNLKAWCARIMENVAMDKSKKKREVLFDEQTMEDMSETTSVIDADTVAIGDTLDGSVFKTGGGDTKLLSSLKSIRLSEDILDCLKRLAENAQQAFLMNTVLGYKRQQISEALGDSIDSIKHRLARSRKSMGACISQKKEAVQ